MHSISDTRSVICALAQICKSDFLSVSVCCLSSKSYAITVHMHKKWKLNYSSSPILHVYLWVFPACACLCVLNIHHLHLRCVCVHHMFTHTVAGCTVSRSRPGLRFIPCVAGAFLPPVPPVLPLSASICVCVCVWGGVCVCVLWAWSSSPSSSSPVTDQPAHLHSSTQRHINPSSPSAHHYRSLLWWTRCTTGSLHPAWQPVTQPPSQPSHHSYSARLHQPPALCDPHLHSHSLPQGRRQTFFLFFLTSGLCPDFGLPSSW